ncbi:MAG TPA: adenosylcobinamide-GDP ribazoletransferase [Gemmataceae bacterium]|nr:adenosylcobinamide-GDP ribazoletransferase [Gemmataceae bacterium]
MRSFLAALAFLTVVPVRLRKPFSQVEVARSRVWYPVVGGLLGAVLGCADMLAARIGSAPVAAFLVLAAWVVLTGGLHVDGFCDLSDGLFGGRNAEERLLIMKDPHLGTFALVGAVLLLLGKWVLIEELFARGSPDGPWLVGTAVGVGRCLALVMAAAAPYPRPEGTGKLVIEATTVPQSILFALIACVGSVVVLFRAGVMMALIPYLASLLFVLLLRQFCLHRLGGITGDCLGAAIEAAELVFLLVAVLTESR